MSGRQLNEEWTAEVVGRMHRYRITRAELASKCHYTQTYLSLVLNGVKEFSSEKAKEKTKLKILKNLELIEADILKEIREEEDWREYFNKTRDFKKEG